MSHLIPYGHQSIDDKDIAAVVDILRSDLLTTGPAVAEFERRFAVHVGAKHAIAVNSGTAALHLAMLAAYIGRGDRVVTSPNTFLASANCAAFVGATPDFCDINPVTYNLCPKSLEDTWRDDTRAIIAVDYAGQPCDMPRIALLARERGAVVIEDACHAVGGQFSYGGRIWAIGGHPWADMTVFSFHPVKTITTGEGGMLVTNNDSYAARARLLRCHGMVRDPAEFSAFVNKAQPSTGEERMSDGIADDCGAEFTSQRSAHDERGPWYYEMQDLGFNYRISDIQCALGLSQLDRLDQFIARRREIVARYNAAFNKLDLVQTPTLKNEDDWPYVSWHLYTVQVNFGAVGKSRAQVMNELRHHGVGAQVLYIPVYLQPWYQQTYGYRRGKCPAAEDYYERALTLPLFPKMSDCDVETVISAMRTVLNGDTARSTRQSLIAHP